MPSDLPIPDTATDDPFEIVESERKPGSEDWDVQWCPTHGPIPMGEEVAGTVSRDGEGDEPWLCPDCLTYRDTRTELLVVNLPAAVDLQGRLDEANEGYRRERERGDMYYGRWSHEAGRRADLEMELAALRRETETTS